MTWELEEQLAAPRPEGRVLGVDLGSRRIGLAVSDDRRRVASALVMLPRGGSREGDHSRLAAVVLETGANLVVVGLPLSLSGGTGPAARAVEAEVADLRLALPVPVECCDERFSTVIARRALVAGGRRPAARTAVVDKMAAAAILQTWLDRRRAWPGPKEPQAGPASPQ
ncbi:MAG TPA: Holliday junction resolvase RuvX [Acidimicrobiales bacterium]|nr:Holliday junction resolvase RuvX [Acidimicrobiales bacterium]